jgi:CheY-like chemotaxis protein
MLDMPRARYRGITVLIVEDHHDSREALRLTLEAAGVKVLEARDGADALQVLGTQRPHLILCDLQMPGMDGFVFIARLHRDPKLAGLRVVALTGRTGHADLLKCWEAGFAGHLAKPLHPEAILAELDRLLWAHPERSRGGE